MTKANFLSLNFNLVVDVIITYICLSVLIQVIWSYGVLIGRLSSTSTKFILVLLLLESRLGVHYKVGAVVVVIIWYLDLQLPMQSVAITTEVVGLNSA